MEIRDYYYNETNRVLMVEFSTKEDGDKFYRVIQLSYSDIEYYSPEIISEDDLINPDESLLEEIISEYLKENDLPDGLSL